MIEINKEPKQRIVVNTEESERTATGLSEFLSKTYGWMAIALVTSALAAWYVGHNESIMATCLNHFLALAVIELGLVFGLSFFIEKISASVASMIFVAYSLLNGITLGFYFMVYTSESIVSTFGVCALMFGVMSAYGYYTKTDLSGIGKLLTFGLIGIIIAGVVNLFLGSSLLCTITSAVGVIVFIGLTAYDTQMIKAIGSRYDGSESFTKLSIVAALQLYLDLINLIIYMLRFIGNKRE